MPDTTTKNGRRDAMILSLLYDTGARVQELVDVVVGDVRFAAPATLRLVGKGNKARIVPLLHGAEALLREYVKDWQQQPFTENDHPLFLNREKQKFSRWGHCLIHIAVIVYGNEPHTEGRKNLFKIIANLNITTYFQCFYLDCFRNVYFML